MEEVNVEKKTLRTTRKFNYALPRTQGIRCFRYGGQHIMTYFPQKEIVCYRLWILGVDCSIFRLNRERKNSATSFDE
ncbi:hypothetical protein JHK87_001509 [Glycine soja]|nr:hypothetical protein JHK87_001509 [Glycine soja]